MPKLSAVYQVSRLIYPKYHPLWFVIYMYIQYHTVIKRSYKYTLKTLPDAVLWNIVKKYPRSQSDVNSCVIVHPSNVYVSDRVLNMCSDKFIRVVIVVPYLLCPLNCLYISNTLKHNAGLDLKKTEFKLTKPVTEKTKFAQEIELAQIVSPVDVSTSVIDEAIKNYFTLPKLVSSGDTVKIHIKYFVPTVFYTNSKLSTVECLYFKCKKVTYNNIETMEECFCVIGKTSIRQAANLQCFLPKVDTISPQVTNNDLLEVPICPYGLHQYYKTLKRAVKPFIQKSRKLPLKPAFLLQGDEGWGYEQVIKALAAKLGMHHFKIANSDLMANIYAQNESKLVNVFFSAKLAAPCIVSIHSFEDFPKNNEGQYDERLINSFIKEIGRLLKNNEFPVILFCCAHTKDLPPQLKQAFLEIFDLDAPSDLERELTLKWLLEVNSFELGEVELSKIANRTHGFYFEDLKMLVYQAEYHFFRNNPADGKKVVLCEREFEAAIDHMQSSYSESIGAPKVPKVQWADVGGLSDVKEEIINTINLPLKHPDLFESSGLYRSGILLFGPPGTGKTLIAKAVATECGICFLAVKGPELLNMYVGQSEQNVREVFDKARQASPCIIFFDELDSLAPNRGLSGDSGGVMDRVVSQLLAEMDGLNAGGKVFVIAATNRPDLIDPALLRPGRFDKLLYVGPCTDFESKLSVLQALTRKFKFTDEFDLTGILSGCPQNITGADLYGVCSAAWSSAARRLIRQIENGELNSSNQFCQDDVIVTGEDFIKAIKDFKPSVSNEDLKYFASLQNELS